MPKNSKHPIVLDDLLTINASAIVKKSKEDSFMLLRWYCNGEMTAGIQCEVQEQEGGLVAHFIYHSHDHLYNKRSK